MEVRSLSAAYEYGKRALALAGARSPYLVSIRLLGPLFLLVCRCSLFGRDVFRLSLAAATPRMTASTMKRMGGRI